MLKKLEDVFLQKSDKMDLRPSRKSVPDEKVTFL
jgi:hypothetical protein